ncbi:MAG TPA: diguanylate cyclase [Burkholderiales bacterium]|nr:diguanylate cyclase [Burkholderiales bacterium]
MEERRESRREEGLRFARRMYLPRAAGLALGAICIAGVLWTNGASPAAWAGLALSCLAWPHLAYRAARHARDPYRAELRNLSVDSAFGGAWIAAMQFNLLPSVVIFVMLCMDKLSVGGARFLARCLAAQAVAAAAVIAVFGLQFEPATTMLEIVCSLPLLVVYPFAVGTVTYRLTRTVRSQNRMLAELSRTDALSRLPNRGHWEEEVAAAAQRCRSSGQEAALMMIDIDYFKAINDRYGHPAGDEVIRAVAAILRDSLRGNDIAGRYGGEEFGVLLPETPAAGATATAERLRARVEAADLERSLGIRGTVSVGIAFFSMRDAGHAQWIARADRALYMAKGAGRNRVVRDDGADPAPAA